MKLPSLTLTHGRASSSSTSYLLQSHYPYPTSHRILRLLPSSRHNPTTILYLWGNNVSKTPSILCNLTHQIVLRSTLCTEELPRTASQGNSRVNKTTRTGYTCSSDCFIQGQAQDKSSRHLGPVLHLLYNTEKDVSPQYCPFPQFITRDQLVLQDADERSFCFQNCLLDHTSRYLMNHQDCYLSPAHTHTEYWRSWELACTFHRKSATLAGDWPPSHTATL